ncbi:MAG: class F sortase [Pseudonocardia sp.]|nr:class F sortase [Pseudonocardia sp.]
MLVALPGQRARPARGALVGGLATAAVLVMAGSIGVVLTSPVDRPAVTVSPAPEIPTSAGPTPLDVRTTIVAVRATALTIPDLGIRSDLVDLGVDGAGALEVPADAAVPGWFTAGAVPGELGPAVIAGHVDSRSGPGVFFRLADLAVGAEVEVGRSDGASARYRVVDVLTVLKSAFPTDRVYGPTSGAELRLITCGGEFDRRTGHYVRNIVVSAVLVDEA